VATAVGDGLTEAAERRACWDRKGHACSACAEYPVPLLGGTAKGLSISSIVQC
jgi:hypothetical protein